ATRGRPAAHRAEAGSGSSATQPPPSFDPAGGNEVDQIVLGDTDMAAELDVGDAALRDQPTHEARRGAQALGSLLDGKHRLQLGWPPLPAKGHAAAADSVVVV